MPEVQIANTIIVDDLIDSGKTIRGLLKKIDGIPMAMVCLYKKTWSPDIPMKLIHVEETDKWVHFPWEPADEKINRSQEVICYFDGSSKNNQGEVSEATCGYMITVDDQVTSQNKMPLGNMTNNEAEYYGLIHLICELKVRGIDKATIYGDSQLVINQVNKVYDCKAQNLRPLLEKVQKLITGKTYILKWIDREKNARVNQLIGGKK